MPSSLSIKKVYRKERVCSVRLRESCVPRDTKRLFPKLLKFFNLSLFMKIKVGDTVVVTTGRSKGTKGKVMQVLKKTGQAIVEKVNIVTKHIKKTQERAGQRIEKEALIDLSNLMLLNKEGEPTRVTYAVPKDGKKYRVAVKGGENLDKPFVKS